MGREKLTGKDLAWAALGIVMVLAAVAGVVAGVVLPDDEGRFYITTGVALLSGWTLRAVIGVWSRRRARHR